MTKLNPSNAQSSLPDPVVTEIIRNAVVAITEEMKSNLMRTAYNMIIYEALDFTVGLFDREGNTVSIGIGLPMFIRGMSTTVKRMISQFDHTGLEDGDVLLTNDAYITGSHLNHMTFVVPIFWRSEVVAFSACMAHWQDVGGTLDGMTSDIYSEGLQVPILKAYIKGKLNQDLVDIIEMNVRIPERAMGDFRAQIAAVKTGERRYLELLGRFELLAVDQSIQEIFKQSEASVREVVKTIPDGEYFAESFMDDDGIELGRKIPIRVKVLVAGDQMTIDLTEVSNQVKGFYNSGEAAGIACAQVAFKCLTAANELPINDGCFKALSVILPPGKVISATRPAPMRWWMTFPMTVVDTVFKALSTAIPQKVIAGHHADLVIASVHGKTPVENKLFLYLGGLIGGGWGAKHNEDGMSATIAINDGDTHNGPSEQVEAKYPLIVEKYGLREDSGGAGRQRGGLGTEQIVRVKSDIMFNCQIERVECKPWGLFGGLSAMGNQVGIAKDGKTQIYTTGKVFSKLFSKDNEWILRSGGGGGFGSPLERKLEDVEQDVKNGYVSAAAAAQLYGVVIDAATGQAKFEESVELRKKMFDLRLPKDGTAQTSKRSEKIVVHRQESHKVRLAAESLYRQANEEGLMRWRCCS